MKKRITALLLGFVLCFSLLGAALADGGKWVMDENGNIYYEEPSVTTPPSEEPTTPPSEGPTTPPSEEPTDPDYWYDPTPATPSKTETVKNPDGSQTTTVTSSNGTVTETTKAPDGSQTVVETKKDGTTTTKVQEADGSKSETVEKPDGSMTSTSTDAAGNKTEVARDTSGTTTTKSTLTDGTRSTATQTAAGSMTAEVSVSSRAVSGAASSGESISLPIPDVPVAATSAAASTVSVRLPESVMASAASVKVEIPADDPAPGTVAILVRPDGSEEVLTKSVVTADGVALSLDGSATIKLVDKSINFVDINSYSVAYAKDAASYVSARELFTGTAEAVFSPTMDMSRQMMMAVMARLDGVDAQGAETYEKGAAWAASKGMTIPGVATEPVTRQEMALIFWQYAGKPASTGTLAGFSDADGVSGDYLAALRWCVEKGIMQGYAGMLTPTASSNRAMVAQMIWNFNNAMMK